MSIPRSLSVCTVCVEHLLFEAMTKIANVCSGNIENSLNANVVDSHNRIVHTNLMKVFLIQWSPVMMPTGWA